MKKKAVELRVTYADTDAMGVVYHTNYIKWFEVGRTEYMRDLGVVYSELEKEGYYLPVTEVYCHYLSPARYDECIQVVTTINFFRRASVRFDYEIYDANGAVMLAEGYTAHAFINREGKIVRAPKYVTEKIGTL